MLLAVLLTNLTWMSRASVILLCLKICLIHKGVYLMIKHIKLMLTYTMYINLSLKLIIQPFHNSPIRSSLKAREGFLCNNMKLRNVAVILSSKKRKGYDFRSGLQLFCISDAGRKTAKRYSSLQEETEKETSESRTS